MKFEKYLTEATVEFYTNAQDRKPDDILNVQGVPALLRALGHGAKKISIESEGDRKALNKALRTGKYIYVAFNPFMVDVAGTYEVLWHTNKQKFVKIWQGLVGEI